MTMVSKTVSIAHEDLWLSIFEIPESKYSKGESFMNSSTRTKVAWRLERLPRSSYITLLGLIIVGAYLLDAIDSGAIGYYLPLFAKEFGLTSAQSGLIGSVSSIGVIAGCFITTFLCDTIGRKKVLVTSMFIWGAFGFLMASSHSLTTLIISRIGIGIGLGAQLPAATALLSEVIPAKLRSFYISLLLASTPAGFAISGLLNYFAIPAVGWRGVAIIEAALFIGVIAVAKAVPESALWLESKGRFEQADAIMTKIEENIVKSTGKELPPVQIPANTGAAKASTGKISILELFSKKYLRSTIMLTLWWPAALFVSIGLSTWFSSLMVAKGFTIIKSIGYVSLMYVGGLLGVPVVQNLLKIKKIGRKWTCVIMPIVCGVFAFCYGMSNVLPLMIIFGMLYNCFIFGAGMANNVYTPELYPTRIRGTAIGYALTVGRVGSFLGPIVIGMIVQNYGANTVFPCVAGLLVFYGLWIALLGKETGGKVFDE